MQQAPELGGGQRHVGGGQEALDFYYEGGGTRKTLLNLAINGEEGGSSIGNYCALRILSISCFRSEARGNGRGGSYRSEI